MNVRLTAVGPELSYELGLDQYKAAMGVEQHNKPLARGDKVTLLWVPEHSGVEGNEKVDELTKSASGLSTAGPQPLGGLGKDQYKAAVQ